MGFLNLFPPNPPIMPMKLPSGCFMVDCTGQVIASTITQAFPKTLLQEIANAVLVAFRDAQAVQMPLAELSVHYASLKLVARELHGGAIVFLTPQIIAHT